jgi:hypothetical protein
VHARPQVQAVSVHLQALDGVAGREGHLHGVLGAREHRHQPVAEALDDAPAPANEGLDLGAHPAQGADRDLVADLERPVGEAREVGEQHREVLVALALVDPGVRLPHLQRGQPDLAQHARPRRRQRGELGGEAPDGVVTGRERVAVRRVAGQP